MSIEFADRAESDIEIAADDIRTETGVAAAQDFAARLLRTLAVLERSPRLGEEIGPPFPRHPGLRVFQVRKHPHHLIFFTPTQDGIRVLHSSRDIRAVFG